MVCDFISRYPSIKLDWPCRRFGSARLAFRLSLLPYLCWLFIPFVSLDWGYRRLKRGIQSELSCIKAAINPLNFYRTIAIFFALMWKISFEQIGIVPWFLGTSLAWMLLSIEAGKDRFTWSDNRKPINWTETKVSEKTTEQPLCERDHRFKKCCFFNWDRFNSSRQTVQEQTVSTNNQRRGFHVYLPYLWKTNQF